ncbi:Na+/H+ antiporter 1 [Kribbella orskensis]|uniref:Na+/H+ antiporter 1 n=2 Tax=Kribbellaceae TaxID=2726069 RepID=A0ABY2BMB7_9ACTN|nr:Na+/H+ antiporter 1 [Kribbella sp. VKM Ac-2500]TCO25527.1 Na+/H+ antiporter 1 [Kribbella orskensis]
MSTDTAFALGMLALVGRRFPVRPRAYLLTLTVVDDVVALGVIAFVYSADIAVLPLLAAVGIFGLVLLVRAAGGQPPRGRRLREIPGLLPSRCETTSIASTTRTPGSTTSMRSKHPGDGRSCRARHRSRRVSMQLAPTSIVPTAPACTGSRSEMDHHSFDRRPLDRLWWCWAWISRRLPRPPVM